jgi:hypothetical protein
MTSSFYANKILTSGSKRNTQPRIHRAANGHQDTYTALKHDKLSILSVRGHECPIDIILVTKTKICSLIQYLFEVYFRTLETMNPNSILEPSIQIYIHAKIY